MQDRCPPLPLSLLLAISPSTCRGGGILAYSLKVEKANSPADSIRSLQFRIARRD
ncbi:hypothetical protein [Holdemania massiliensis]|nr:hypothetical protein [Holdemania massiliensis]